MGRALGRSCVRRIEIDKTGKERAASRDVSRSEYESCLRQTLEITLQLFGAKHVPIWTIQFIALSDHHRTNDCAVY